MSKPETDGEVSPGVPEPKGKHPLIDPELQAVIENTPYEDLIVEMDGSKQRGGRTRRVIDFVREWFSPENDYRADTFITAEQAYAMSVLRNLDKIYPQVGEDLQEFIDAVIDDYERYALSIDGFARQQEADILRSLAGDRSELTPSDRDSLFAKAMVNPPPQED